MKQKKSYTAKQKVEIRREHLENQVPVSELYERYYISPDNFNNLGKNFLKALVIILTEFLCDVRFNCCCRMKFIQLIYARKFISR